MFEDRHLLAVAEAAARIMCEDGIKDYAHAKRKALRTLGMSDNAPQPTNALVHAAVLEHQQLFGADAVPERLRHMRTVALHAMAFLDDYRPRLTGGVLSGAIGLAEDTQHITLHAFADAAEEIDILLLNRGWDFDTDERRFQVRSGTFITVPTTVFDFEGEEIEVSVFPSRGAGNAPLSPVTGDPLKRADAAEIKRLLAESSAQ